MEVCHAPCSSVLVAFAFAKLLGRLWSRPSPALGHRTALCSALTWCNLCPSLAFREHLGCTASVSQGRGLWVEPWSEPTVGRRPKKQGRSDVW